MLKRKASKKASPKKVTSPGKKLSAKKLMVFIDNQWMPISEALPRIIAQHPNGNSEPLHIRGFKPNETYAPKGDTETKPATATEYGDSVLGTQVGGDHYKKMGHYQPWEVLKQWLTEEEFRGYMKGTAIAYLAREQEKGKDTDVGKAAHTLEALLEMIAK